jgi:hypothetical protein
VAGGKAVRIALTLTGKTADNLPSGNVIGELPGSDPSLPPILVGCHLDSWDLGTGAIDDAAGCAIVTAAALKAQEGASPCARSACCGRGARNWAASAARPMRTSMGNRTRWRWKAILARIGCGA